MSSPDDLRAWQAALDVAVRTRQLLTLFPARGFAELRDQMIRSAESIGHNIAEGRASKFQLEYISYLNSAVRSAGELSSQLKTLMAYGVAPKRTVFNLNGTVICAKRMTEALRDAVQSAYDEECAIEKSRKPK